MSKFREYFNMSLNEDISKVLEIMKDNIQFKTCYFTLNLKNDTKFFEGKYALKLAKEWAKKNGYTKIILISSTMSKSDKEYLIK